MVALCHKFPKIVVIVMTIILVVVAVKKGPPLSTIIIVEYGSIATFLIYKKIRKNPVK